MAEETLVITGVHAGEDDWVLGAGSSKVAAITDADDGTFIKTPGTTPNNQGFDLADPVDIQVGDTVNTVKVRVRGQAEPGQNASSHATVLRNAGGGASNTWSPEHADGVIATQLGPAMTDPTASGYDISVNLNVLTDLYVRFRTQNTKLIDLMFAEVVVDYTPAGGGGGVAPKAIHHRAQMAQ